MRIYPARLRVRPYPLVMQTYRSTVGYLGAPMRKSSTSQTPAPPCGIGLFWRPPIRSTGVGAVGRGQCESRPGGCFGVHFSPPGGLGRFFTTIPPHPPPDIKARSYTLRRIGEFTHTSIFPGDAASTASVCVLPAILHRRYRNSKLYRMAYHTLFS